MASQRPPQTDPFIEYQLPPCVEFETAAGGHETVPLPFLGGDTVPFISPPPLASNSGEPGTTNLQYVSPLMMESWTSAPQSFLANSPQVLVLRPGMPTASGRPVQGDNRRRRGQYDSKVWEDHKDKIRQLYLEQSKPLREVIETMASTYNFHATEKMYKIRIKHWGFAKNNTRKDVGRMLKARFVREAMGKRSEFIRNGRAVDIDDYLRRKGLTEYDVVDLDGPAEDALRAVRCRTPPGPERLALPERLRHQEGYVLAMRRALQFWASDPREQDRGYWVTKNYTYIKDLRQAMVQTQTGETGRAIETLQAVLQTKLSDVDQLDCVGAMWLMLVPATWSHVPIITTTLFKYVTLNSLPPNHQTSLTRYTSPSTQIPCSIRNH